MRALWERQALSPACDSQAMQCPHVLGHKSPRDLDGGGLPSAVYFPRSYLLFPQVQGRHPRLCPQEPYGHLVHAQEGHCFRNTSLKK